MHHIYMVTRQTIIKSQAILANKKKLFMILNYVYESFSKNKSE